MAADVLADEQQLASGREEAGRVQPAGAGEAGLSHPLREVGEQVARDRRTVRQDRRVDSTLIAHARAGLPGITAHTWLDANPLPAGLRAIPLVEPEIERTIGLVASTAIERTPVITELFDLLAGSPTGDPASADDQ